MNVPPKPEGPCSPTPSTVQSSAPSDPVLRNSTVNMWSTGSPWPSPYILSPEELSQVLSKLRETLFTCEGKVPPTLKLLVSRPSSSITVTFNVLQTLQSLWNGCAEPLSFTSSIIRLGQTELPPLHSHLAVAELSSPLLHVQDP